MFDPTPMTRDMMAALQPGDLISHRGSGESLVVTANYGNRVTAVRTYDVTNPCEWLVIRRSSDRI